MTAHEHGPTAAAPAAIEIDWIWGTPRGYIIRVEGHAFGPMSFDDLRHFPRWLFRRLFELKDYELDVALAVSRRLNDLKRGEWQQLLVRCDNWLVRWRPRKPRFRLHCAGAQQSRGPTRGGR